MVYLLDNTGIANPEDESTGNWRGREAIGCVFKREVYSYSRILVYGRMPVNSEVYRIYQFHRV